MASNIPICWVEVNAINGVYSVKCWQDLMGTSIMELYRGESLLDALVWLKKGREHLVRLEGE